MDATTKHDGAPVTIYPRWLRLSVGILLALVGFNIGTYLGRIIVTVLGLFGGITPSTLGAIIVAILTVAFAYPGYKIAFFKYPFESIEGFTKLMYFAAEGSVEGMELEWSSGSDINAVDSKGGTALFYAARNGHTAAVTWLLSLGANVSTTLPNGQTAADIAQKSGHAELADIIRIAQDGLVPKS